MPHEIRAQGCNHENAPVLQLTRVDQVRDECRRVRVGSPMVGGALRSRIRGRLREHLLKLVYDDQESGLFGRAAEHRRDVREPLIAREEFRPVALLVLCALHGGQGRRVSILAIGQGIG